MTTTTPSPPTAVPGTVRTGATLMAIAAAGFIGYAGLFLARNFSGGFLELGIGPGEVDVTKDQLQQYSPSLAHYLASRTELLWRVGEIMELITSGALKVRVSGVYPLADAAQAHRDLESRKTSGKLLLRVS